MTDAGSPLAPPSPGLIELGDGCEVRVDKTVHAAAPPVRLASLDCPVSGADAEIVPVLVQLEARRHGCSQRGAPAGRLHTAAMKLQEP